MLATWYYLDFRPLALTPGLQLKARLMVKDKQLQDMWNPGETLLRVCFEQADDGIFVVASNFSDTQTFKVIVNTTLDNWR